MTPDSPASDPSYFLVHCYAACPYFAEIPAFCWGNVDYTFSTDARFPTDREWRRLTLLNRENGERLALAPLGEDRRRAVLAVRASDPGLAARAAYFLLWRTDGRAQTPTQESLEAPDDFAPRLAGWDVAAGLARSVRVRDEFGRVELLAFDTPVFWRVWKWAGAWATPDLQAWRLLITALLRRDPRGVPLAIGLLRQGVPSAEHEAALHNVLSRLTRRSLDSTPAWLAWYAAEGRQQYPAPDWTAWREEVLRTAD
jgi:hypothetical protein